MNVGRHLSRTPGTKLSILLMDANAERRALRKKIMALHGVEVIGASDLTEASSIWHRDRYDMVLMDIRRDHRGCLAWRDEIKKDDPQQVVAFLVGKPNFVDMEPEQASYAAEEYGTEWGDSMRKAVRDSCDMLPQRYSFVEAGWRIAAARKMSGAPSKTAAVAHSANDMRSETLEPAQNDFVNDPVAVTSGAES